MRSAASLILTAQFLFGIGILLLLPPFEGFDETAHYSRLVSDTFMASGPGGFITADVVDYEHRGPMPYGWIGFASIHRLDPTPIYKTYRDFFAEAGDRLDYIQAYRVRPIAIEYNPGLQPNWEYQHPALYYKLMSPLVAMLAGRASLVDSLVNLRFASFLLAFLGFVIGYWATWDYARRSEWPQADKIALLGLLYPFLTPEFFWEFARIGNDSLCLFLFGVAWAFLLRLLDRPHDDAWIYLGFVLGLGCLTKALMVPVTLGIAACLLIYHHKKVQQLAANGNFWWMPTAKIMALAALVCSPHYIDSVQHQGILGAGEFSMALHTAHALQLLQSKCNGADIGSGLAQIIFTMIGFFETLSATIVSMLANLLLYVLSAFIVAAYSVAVLREPPRGYGLPLWILVPMLFGLFAHVAVSWIVGGTMTPGWYLHILAPALALIYGVGVAQCIHNRWGKIVMTLMGVFAVVFNYMIVWSYLTVFSGCAVPIKHSTSFMDIVYWLNPKDVFRCSVHSSEMFDHMRVLAWPDWALLSFALSVMGLLAAVWLLAQRRRQPIADLSSYS